MVYRRFGIVYSRLLLHKQDEMSRMEALLNAMDKTDSDGGNGQYLMSRVLDDERECIPNTFPDSRMQLMERLEKKALEYGKN